MRITYGVILAMGVSLLGAAWALKQAWGATQVWEDRANAAEERVDNLTARFERLDEALLELAGETRANREALDTRLTEIRDLQQSENDSDETMQCLDLPVPTALDHILRRTAGRDSD